MNDKYQTTIDSLSSILRLRKPQKDAHEILAQVCELVKLSKQASTEDFLQKISEHFPYILRFLNILFPRCASSWRQESARCI